MTTTSWRKTFYQRQMHSNGGYLDHLGASLCSRKHYTWRDNLEGIGPRQLTVLPDPNHVSFANFPSLIPF